MKRETFESHILDYLEDLLPEEKRMAFEQALKTNPEFEKLFTDYQNILQVEKSLQSVSETVHPSFSAQVLARIDTDAGFFKGKLMELIKTRHLRTMLAGSVCLILCVGLLVNNQHLLRRSSPANGVLESPAAITADKDSTQAGLDSHELTEPVADAELPGQPSSQSVQTMDLQQPAAELKLERSLSAENKEVQPRAYSESVTVGELSSLPADHGGTQHAPKSKPDTIRERSYLVEDRIQNQQRVEGKSMVAEDRSITRGNSYKQKILLESNSNYRSTTPPPHSPVTAQIHPLQPDSNLFAESDSYGASKPEFSLNPNAPGYQQSPLRAAAHGEQYTEWEESEPKRTKTDPLSTFSIDVDTGSYTNARRFLNQGILPPASAVRVEEFLNYFSYGYKAPVNEPFALHYEIAPAPLDPDRHLLKIGLKAREAKQQNTPWNLVFLIDVSGSMNSPDKLGLARQALGELVANMRDQDRVSIVTYAGRSGVLLRAASISHRDKIQTAINSLVAGGSTHGSAGIKDAYRIAEASFIKNGVNRIVLVTDGDFNVGTTGTAELISLVEEKKRSGVTLTTVGLGSGNYNESMLEQLANKGDGNYFYLDSFAEAQKVFSKDLYSNMEVIAHDVKIQIEFNPAVVSQYRLIGYDNRRLKNQDFNNDRVDAGEVGAGHTVTALYELVLKDSTLGKQLDESLRYAENNEKDVVQQDTAASNNNELAFFKLRYKESAGARSTLRTFPLLSSQIQSHSSSTSDDFRFAAAVSYFGLKLRQSKHIGTYGYADIQELAASALGTDSEGYRKEFLELVRKADR